ncbi:MAG: prepilin-type N-terminal cleavage/methylation domain-containing protein [Methylophaga sp.]|nr:prepilin-type N-terminal cleavage/methylation domain-containing protein [Methylophaga sp.]
MTAHPNNQGNQGVSQLDLARSPTKTKMGGSLIEKGATLIELIITIVIISVALSGILSVVNITTKHSADPIIQSQAIAIAESYLEEILLLPIIDPNGNNAGEDRATFDNIDDYNGLSDLGAIDQSGSAIAGLENYNVTVTVADNTVSGVTMKAVTVSVSLPSITTIELVGYRASY